MSRCFVALAQNNVRCTSDLLSAVLWQQSAEMGAKRRPSFLTGRLLLTTLMRENFGCDDLPEIVYDDQGKPAFRDRVLPSFSISHSGRQVLVAVCPAGEIGADVETLRPRASMRYLAQQIFSPSEYQWLLTLGEFQQAAFWQLWTLREALLKQQGRSVWQMASVSIDPLQQRFSGVTQPLQLLSAVDDQCAIALALPLSVRHIEAFQSDSCSVLSSWSAPWRSFLAKDILTKD